MPELHILDKAGVDHRLGNIISWPQRDILTRVTDDLSNRVPSRYIVLKARQIGVSTVIEGIGFACAVGRRNLKGLVVAHENDSSAHLLGMTRYYYDSFWAKEAFPTKHAAVNQLAWQHTNSHLKIATAKNMKAGRSRTLQFLHCSEVGFWDQAEILMTGLQQSVARIPGTMIFLESTANGVGNYFYNTWQAATEGDVQYVPLFYPWWAHPEYTAHNVGLQHLTEGAFVCIDDEERHLMSVLGKPLTVNGRRYQPLERDEIVSRLVWRRDILGTECQGDLNKLHQEYPSEPEEAFIATGTNVFAKDRVLKVYEPMDGDVGRLLREPNGKVRFVLDHNGPLTIFRHPADNRQWGFYMVGGDPKKAVEGDYACAQVINRKTWEQCAEWRGKVDQNTFGEQMILLGSYYNNAMLAPESGIGGPGVAAHIIAKGYPHLWQHRKGNKMPGQLDQQWGWITNLQTKQEAIGNVQSALYDATVEPAYSRGIGIRIHSRVLYNEMCNYVTLPDGGFGNAADPDLNDDCVMAYAIALTCTRYEQLQMATDAQYEAPRYHRREYQSELSQEDAVAFDQAAARLGVDPAPVLTADGKMRAVEEADFHYLQDETPDLYGGDDW